MCCVPTLLATIEKDLPDLRLLLLSGEACPQHLVTRWHRPGRRILNVYGPTEATVTATMTEVTPDKAVTIGGPLPTYTIVILEAEKDALVGEGESGEIAIAGIGLAEGYLNRPDLTGAEVHPRLRRHSAQSFEAHLSHRRSRPHQRDGEVEFQGRIDTQVKVRGYRIELTEIESLLMELPQVAQAVVSTFEPEPGALELVAYYSLNKGAEELSPEEMCKSLRDRLPCYMVPAYFEKLAVIPMTTSNKADRKNLPAPKGGRLTGANDNYVAPRTATEETLAAALAKALKIERVSVTDDFFQRSRRALAADGALLLRHPPECRRSPTSLCVTSTCTAPSRTLAAKLDAGGAGRRRRSGLPRRDPRRRATSNITAAARCRRSSTSATWHARPLDARDAASNGPTPPSTISARSISARRPSWFLPSSASPLCRSRRNGCWSAASRRRASRSGACATSASGW